MTVQYVALHGKLLGAPLELPVKAWGGLPIQR